MKIFIVLFIVVFSCAQALADDLLFSDNFDDGNLAGWTAQLAAISTEQASSGTCSVKITHSGTALLRRDMDSSVMAGYTDITIKYKWMTGSTWITGTGVKFARLRQPSQLIQTELWWAESLGNEPRAVGGSIYGTEAGGAYGRWTGSYLTSALYGSAAPFLRGQWQDIEIHYVLNTVSPYITHDGTLEIWINGSKVVSYVGLVQFRNTAAAFSQFYLPSNIGTSSAANVNYIDDVEIWGNTGTDTTPPSIGGGSPTGILPAGTTQTTMAIGTGEAATCRYSATDVAYASMASVFGSTGGVSHSQALLGLTDGTNYTYYARCIDGAGNASTSSTVISFSVAETGADCEADAALCNSDEDCNLYWPAYHWCGGGLPICQAAACPASCDADHYYLCGSSEAALSAGHYYWEGAPRTIPDIGGSGNLLSNPGPSTWSGGLPTSWTTYTSVGVSQDAALGIRLANGGAIAQLSLQEGHSYRWAANIKGIASGQLETWHYNESTLSSAIGTVTGAFTVPAGPPDHRVFFKAPTGANDITVGDFVVRDITSGVSGATLGGAGPASLSGASHAVIH